MPAHNGRVTRIGAVDGRQLFPPVGRRSFRWRLDSGLGRNRSNFKGGRGGRGTNKHLALALSVGRENDKPQGNADDRGENADPGPDLPMKCDPHDPLAGGIIDCRRQVIKKFANINWSNGSLNVRRDDNSTHN
ncbi:hypothetical protein [Rhodopseudomonas sp. RCAM05734]|uniref:hypothetical protein n=1 Tax=Rhodopseudomonas sp. RCAM05734 TaxID=3457549 RepID=UPI004044894D